MAFNLLTDLVRLWPKGGGAIAKHSYFPDLFIKAFQYFNMLDLEVSDTAPTDTTKLWVDPNDPATDAPSILKAFNGTTWAAATTGQICTHIVSRASLTLGAGSVGYTQIGVGSVAPDKLNLTIVSQTLTVPPAVPSTGVLYIVGAGATGAWSGQAGRVALWNGSAWSFFTPTAGMIFYDAVAGAFVGYTAAGWVTFDAQDKYTAATSPPSSPSVNDVWLNTNSSAVSGIPSGQKGLWNGSTWIVLGGASFTVSATAPTGASPGDEWWDTTDETLNKFVNDGANSFWIDITSAGGGTTGAAAALSSDYVQQATQPTTRTNGMRWKNTSAGTINGVAAGRIGMWDATNNVWDQLN